MRWHQPGRVWATDHAEPSEPTDSYFGAILAVRDLASGMQLAWQPVTDQTAAATIDLLQPLFEQYGPTLVLRADPLQEGLADGIA